LERILREKTLLGGWRPPEVKIQIGVAAQAAGPHERHRTTREQNRDRD
jgi:hypothetical protein